MRVLVIAAASLMISATALAAEEKELAPTIQDLSFLIGEWEIESHIYYHDEPDRLLFVENGKKTCAYDLRLNEKPMYITCNGQWTVENDNRKRYRETRDSIRYNRFFGGFEEIGVYSNWPAHGANRMRFDKETRTLVIEGELELPDGVIERLQTTIVYNETFDAYEARNVANFSYLPVTQFNRVFTETGRKVGGGERP